jgi:hypothetical protein
MTDISLSMGADERAEDLPRTLRNATLRTSDESASRMVGSNDFVGDGAVVTDIQIPFWKLVIFLMKVALAALPALIIVAIMLYGLAEIVGALFPQLVKMKIQIYVPSG